MKKIILFIILFFGLVSSAYAQDYWVYIRMEDRPGVTKEDDAGRSKRGDVVHIQKAVPGHEPTDREKAEYSIITVSDLKQKDIDDLLEKKVDEDYVKQDPLEPDKHEAMRSKSLDVDTMGLQKGFVPGKFTDTQIKDKIKVKTTDVIARYHRQVILNRFFARPLRQIDNIIVRRAYAAQDISKVCATGSNCTDEEYNSLVTWEDTEDGDLDGENRQETAECYDDDGDLTAKPTIDGSTTSSTDYMEITAPVGERHDGTHSGGGATVNASGNETIKLNDPYSRLSWLILEGQTGTGFLHAAVEYSGNTNGTINNLVIYSPAGGCTAAWVTDPITIHTIMCIDTGTTGFYSNSANSPQYLHDSTCLSSGDYCVDGTGFDCDNLALFNSAIEDSSGCSSETNVATSDSSGTTGLINLTASDQFVSVTGGSEDLHLKSGSDLESAGATPTSGVHPDIDNTTRPQGTYDVGADEFEEAAEPSFKPRVYSISKK